MTSTANPIVKDKSLKSLGLVETANVNSFADFIPSKSIGTEEFAEKEKNDFINTFICHLIFYAVLCISLALYIIIDLGLGSFLKKTFINLIEIAKNNFVEKKPAFA